MTISEKQIDFIQSLDEKAKTIIFNSDQETLLLCLLPKLNQIKDLLTTSTQEEVQLLRTEYTGFSQCMDLLFTLGLLLSNRQELISYQDRIDFLKRYRRKPSLLVSLENTASNDIYH